MSEPATTLICPYCGYDLRTLTTDACPECGGAVDEQSLIAAHVPWEARHQIGTVRALWRTAWRVTWKTKAFCHAVARPVDYAAARRFQLITVTALWVSLVVAALVVLALNGEWDLQDMAEDYGPLRLWLGLGLGAAGLYVFLLLGTGLHTYWLHPRRLDVERQNRAIALGYYACGPLLLALPMLWTLTAAFVIRMFALELEREWVAVFAQALFLICLFGLLLMPIAFVFVCSSMACNAAGRGSLGRASLTLGQPAALALLACFTVLGLPAFVGYAWLIAVTW